MGPQAEKHLKPREAARGKEQSLWRTLGRSGGGGAPGFLTSGLQVFTMHLCSLKAPGLQGLFRQPVETGLCLIESPQHT